MRPQEGEDCEEIRAKQAVAYMEEIRRDYREASLWSNRRATRRLGRDKKQAKRIGRNYKME